MDYDYPLKSLKKSSCVEEDRISHLSTDIICKILSFVTPTKYAVRTSVLSKRWENLWAFSQKITLEYPLGTRNESHQSRELRAATFMKSVDNLFFLRDCLRIEFLNLCIYGDFNSFRARASSWVCAVVMCNVRELDLRVDSVDSDLGELPWCLFTCKSLVVLRISGKFILSVPYHVCLPYLKTLSLQCIIYLGDAVIQKLLSGCPVLEDLSFYIHEWERIWTLNVTVASLKRLSLSSNVELDRDVERVYRHRIAVDAPNLEFIDLADAWPNDILLKFLPKIVEAHIDIGHADDTIDVEKVDKLVLLFQSIVNVRRLFLGCLTFLILDEDIEFNLPRFCNLVFMELDYSNGPFQLMELLHSAPNLEALSFPKGFNYERRIFPDIDYDDGDIDLEFRMNDLERIPECLHHSLKLVEIKAFRGEEVELNIVWYLLENAMVLEKMTCFYCRKIDIIKLQTDLTNHPRLSTNCQLHFKPDPRV